MMKEIKDLSKNVRVSSEAIKDIERLGWSTQRLLDWAIGQIRKKGIKPEVKK